MSQAFHLKIISPSAVVDAHVPSAEIPGAEGDFGVLPGHAPFFSMLRPGVLELVMSDGTHRSFFAATGYADVTPTSCTVLSDHIQDLSEISESDAQEAVIAARAALSSAENMEERQQAEKLLQSAEALASALGARAA